MKLFGHPPHQILIVFPAGLLLTATAFDAAALATGSHSFWNASYLMIAAGIAGGLIAAVFGLIDWLAIPRGTRARRIGAVHGLGNAVVLMLYGTSLWVRASPEAAPELSAALFGFLGAALLGLTGWLGGELVSRLGIGVDADANPNASNSLEAHQALEWGNGERAAQPRTPGRT